MDEIKFAQYFMSLFAHYFMSLSAIFANFAFHPMNERVKS